MGRGKKASIHLIERIKEVLIKEPGLTQKQLRDRFGCHPRIIREIRKELGQENVYEKGRYLTTEEATKGYHKFLKKSKLEKRRLGK